MKGFPTSADIYLELDGRKIAVVQSYRAKAAKSSKNIEAFGESEPVATIEGQKSYTVELTRLYATDMTADLPCYKREEWHEIILHAL